MKFIVRIPELDSSLYGHPAAPAGRQELLGIIRKLELSGKMLYGGLLADDRGGFFLMEADSFAQMECFLGSVFNPARYTVESHPILPFNRLEPLMAELGKLPGSPAAPARKSRGKKTLQPASV